MSCGSEAKCPSADLHEDTAGQGQREGRYISDNTELLVSSTGEHYLSNMIPASSPIGVSPCGK